MFLSKNCGVAFEGLKREKKWYEKHKLSLVILCVLQPYPAV